MVFLFNCHGGLMFPNPDVHFPLTSGSSSFTTAMSSDSESRGTISPSRNAEDSSGRYSRTSSSFTTFSELPALPELLCDCIKTNLVHWGLILQPLKPNQPEATKSNQNWECHCYLLDLLGLNWYVGVHARFDVLWLSFWWNVWKWHMISMSQHHSWQLHKKPELGYWICWKWTRPETCFAIAYSGSNCKCLDLHLKCITVSPPKIVSDSAQLDLVAWSDWKHFFL